MENPSGNELSYAAKKERFITVTLENEKAKSTHLYVLTRAQYSALIYDIEEALKAVTKTAVQLRRLKRFEVVVTDGKKNLVSRAARLENKLRYFLPIEEIYDVIDQTHQAFNHAGRDKMITELGLKYANVTREMVVLYLSLCETCLQKKKNGFKQHNIAKDTTSEYETLINSRCQIDIIDFQKKPDGQFKFVMVYQDHKTKFTLLRALKTESPSEIAHKLIDIFLTIGAPCILQSNNRKPLIDKIIHHATSLWPELVILSGKIGNPIRALENINQVIEININSWLKHNMSTMWSESLRYVQFTRNRTYNPDIKKSPFKAMFGSPPKTGLGTIPLPPELLEAIKAGKPFKAILPKIINCTSVDFGESSSRSNIDPESSDITIENDTDATQTLVVKEEVNDEESEDDIDFSATNTEETYLNLQDSDMAVETEGIEIEAIKRELLDDNSGSDKASRGTVGCELNVSSEEETAELPAKKLKTEHQASVRYPTLRRSTPEDVNGTKRLEDED